MRCTTINCWLLTAVAACCGGVCQGQTAYRDGQPVITPALAPAAPLREDIALLFANAYQSYGSPRIMLMWNRELGERTQSAVIDIETTREVGSTSSNGLEKTTQGPAESATLKDTGKTFDRTKTVTSSKTVEADAARPNKLTERNLTMLQRVFENDLNRGGVQLVDRALVMRLTAAKEHRTGGDPRLVETDALLAFADLLIEVLMVEDQDAPTGYGFDVRAKDLKRGVTLASVYSRAIPPAPPGRPGSWVAGTADYVFAHPPPPPPPTPGQVGAALARDVMFTLGSAMEATKKSLVPRRTP